MLIIDVNRFSFFPVDFHRGILVQSDAHQLPDSPQVRAEDRVVHQQHRHPEQYVHSYTLELILFLQQHIPKSFIPLTPQLTITEN